MSEQRQCVMMKIDCGYLHVHETIKKTTLSLDQHIVIINFHMHLGVRLPIRFFFFGVEFYQLGKLSRG